MASIMLSIGIAFLITLLFMFALPPVARCVEEARPFRPFFPLGAPDRD